MRKVSPVPAFRTDYGFAADVSSGVDKDWVVVDAPHDFIAEYGNFSDNAENFKQGYLPRNASWYRKHFSLPSAWRAEGETYVHFEGVFHHATLFLNGHYLMSHECGYTGFTVRLDNHSAVRFGAAPNVLAVRADASFGSGHWYEGGGLYRNVRLVHHSGPTRFVHDGVFVSPELAADAKSVRVTAEVETDAAADDEAAKATVRMELVDADGKVVAAAVAASPGAPSGVVEVQLPVTADLKRWSTQSPHMYTVRATLLSPNASVALDAVSLRVGFRATHFGVDPTPFSLNGHPVKFRGFSHHNSIGALGVAIPERIELFRVQASRGMGANIWRMSHNPYAPALYDVLDTLGVMSWDENRDYGAKYGGGAYVTAMHDMVKRDRNHPSIVIWSFCNEYECEQNDANYSGSRYRAAAYGVDGTRPVTANGPAAPDYLDVQGFSHKKNNTFERFHKGSPTKPSVLSECCSCTSQRPDRSLPSCIAEENSPGLLPYVTGSLGVWTLMDYFGEPHGTGSSAWPYVSCDFGQFDIAGFPKPHAYWYRANWLQKFSADTYGRPPLPSKTVVRILDLTTASSSSGNATVDSASGQSLSAITTAPFAELWVDGQSKGRLSNPRTALGEFSSLAWRWDASRACSRASFPHNASGVQCKGLEHVGAADEGACAQACCAREGCNTWQWNALEGNKKHCWVGMAKVGGCGSPAHPHSQWVGGQRDAPPPPAPFRNATVVAFDASGAKALGSHTLLGPASNATRKLVLQLDVPSASTGTGSALLLDGRDTAMVRVSVVGDNGALIDGATDRVSWRVVSGPGSISGTSNGDPTSHEWLKSPSGNLWGGLGRVFVTVTLDCVSANRELVAAIDGDQGPTVVGSAKACVEGSIVLEAAANGFAATRLSIPVSPDAATHGVLAVASATASDFADGFSYVDSFVG